MTKISFFNDRCVFRCSCIFSRIVVKYMISISLNLFSQKKRKRQRRQDRRKKKRRGNTQMYHPVEKQHEHRISLNLCCSWLLVFSPAHLSITSHTHTRTNIREKRQRKTSLKKNEDEEEKKNKQTNTKKRELCFD